MLEGYVRIRSNRIYHKHLYGKIGEIFGYVCHYWTGTVKYGVSLGDKDYEFYEHELEKVE